MKCHQILTGAANKGDRTFGVGSVEGVTFTAYAAGCNVVILSSNFERVQIIPGVCHSQVQIRCISASVDTGKIAAAYGNKVIIFEPTPLLEQNSSHGLDYWWVETALLESECAIATLAWNNDGNRIITAGEYIQIWHHKIHEDEGGISFEVGGDKTSNANNNSDKVPDNADKAATASWICFWKTRPANPIVYLAYSHDGTLFATAGKRDRLVRIWYQNHQMSLANAQGSLQQLRNAIADSSSGHSISFSYIYLAHPRGVTGLSWRKTSKYMPKRSVANMLVTSCLDNICRLWSETILPEDGIVSLAQMDPSGAAKGSKFRTHRQKARFIQRFKHLRQSFTARKMSKTSMPMTAAAGKVASGGGANPKATEPVPVVVSSLPSTYSPHEFHNYYGLSSTTTPGLHFHLSATINAKSDIPLVPSMNSSGAVEQQHNFVLHWLNNKEMQFTMEAEKIMDDLFRLEQSGKNNFELELGEDYNKSQQQPVKKGNPKSGTNVPRVSSNVSLANSDGSSGHHGSITSMSHNASNLSDMLDNRIDRILKEWHQNSDLLFSVHPVDGSLLVWVADFLDEYLPGSFRQAQVSFSSRIPNALPLGDAMTMGSNVELFNPANMLNLREMFSREMDREEAMDKEEEVPAAKKENKSQKYKPPPIVSMISKHTNGTLNLWSVMFAERSKFSQLLNISHSSRASGHRFRVNGVTCHPVLPLLLTTSHHNIVNEVDEHGEEGGSESFCSELILWRVDPVGPLSSLGGITELARINSNEISAFSDVAWIPTLLPSTTLGSISNSPSACFVASDGYCLRVYQAIIDARTLLAEMEQAARKTCNINMSTSFMSMSSGHSSSNLNPLLQPQGGISLGEKFKIVSTQSTAKPGAIIELEAITEATQNWQSTLMLHAFQEQLILSQDIQPPTILTSNQMGGRGTVFGGLITSKMSAIVDLQQQTSGFCEPFYTLVAEKTTEGVLMHMWRLVIASQSDQADDDNATSGSITPDGLTDALLHHNQQKDHPCSEVHVSTEKVCTQRLPLPDSVEVIHAVPAVGHLSSASIYPACLAPYVMVTACSDHTVRFWKVSRGTAENGQFSWQEWEMESLSGHSSITLPGMPVSVSAAYSGRIACAYQTGHSFKRPNVDPTMRYVNLCVGIYECESTGGSEWILEDTINLKNIELQPEIPAMDLTVYEEAERKKKKKKNKFAQHLQEDHEHEKELPKNIKGLIAVPSLSTFDGVKKYISQMGNSPSAVAPKQSVMLDWVSNEDGSHILTVAVGNKVLLLTAVSSDISQASMKAINDARNIASTSRPLLKRASSIGFQQCQDEIRWMQIRRIALRTADGLNPTPMAISWVRDGILMCGMDNEIAVYSQWRAESSIIANASGSANAGRTDDIVDHRHLKEADILNLAQESQMRNVRSHATFSSLAKASSFIPESRKKAGTSNNGSDTSDDIMPDFGLFEAAHIACPVLPQYHPKQLMELLNSGKIRWVKAILGHLVRCIGGPERMRNKSTGSGSFTGEEPRSPRNWNRTRTLSVSLQPQDSLSPGGDNRKASISLLPEEVTLDYAEICSIPPLPLWTLLAADKETGGGSNKDGNADYDDLFSGLATADDNLDSLLEEDDDFFEGEKKKKRNLTGGDASKGLSNFGPRQARILSKLLTHAHLPGLTSLDQMHLLAVADTVATCQLDLADRFAIDAAKRQIAKETSTASADHEPSPESLDDCGLRFLLAMRHFAYLQRCLPFAQRKQLSSQGLSSSYLIWGFHSESEEELLQMIPSVSKGNPTWNELRELGVGWWVRSNNLLRKLMEKVAKASFQGKQDPLDAAIFYLAMKKKSLVWGLYRSVKDDRMTKFFANDFSEDRWRQAALKNAYALLGKQRFLHAAAFFLLSGSLKDAVEICIDKMDDLQLAMVIARLYDGEITPCPDSLKSLLYVHVLGRDKEGQNENLEVAHPDPFLRSIALWINKDYSQSLATLVNPDIGQLNPHFSKDEALALAKRKTEADPAVFNFYIYLRTHPLISRQQMANNKNNSASENSVTPLERRLYFSTAHFHLRGGCPALAVEVLSKLPMKVSEDTASLRPKSPKRPRDTKLETGTFHHEDELNWSKSSTEPERTKDLDWGAPVETKLDSSLQGMDWGPSVVTKDEDELKLEWSDDPDSDEDEDTKKNDKKKKAAEKVVKFNEEEEKDPEDHGHENASGGGVLDIMAQQLKFIACLKIMMEELSTLATGFEVDGGLLRYQLYIWLEREVEALKQLCNYGGIDQTDPGEEDHDHLHSTMSELLAANKRRTPTLHEVMIAEKADFEVKVNRAVKRKHWLKANQTLLRTLLSYCGLHGANGGGLASVRMELILLLQEVHQEKTQKQLLSPLPFPTTLPLLSACIAQQKMVVTDPIRHLQAMAHDMLGTIVGQKQPPLPGEANYSAIFLLRDLSVALSSCIYQSLCDSDSINMKKLASRDGPASAILEALSRLSVVYQDSSLISTSAIRKMSFDEATTEIYTDPSKWPGVTSLRALLDREKDEETPNLNVLLCETFVAVYMSLLSYALASCDAQILFRLVSQKITVSYWSHIFGGGAKKTLHIETASSSQQQQHHPPLSKESSNDPPSSSENQDDSSGLLNTMTSITKRRVQLNMKLLGVQLGTSQDNSSSPGAAAHQQAEKQSYREQFIPPEMSIVSKLMSKTQLDATNMELDFDSGDDASEDEEEDDNYEDDDPFSNAPPKPENREASNPGSYAWALMRYGCIRMAQITLEKFISMAGIELPELPVASPLIYASLRITESWIDSTLSNLNCSNPPDNFIPGCNANFAATGPAIQKYKSLFELQNTPFPSHGHGLRPVKRLWQFLVRQKPAQQVFVKYIFSHRRHQQAANFGGMPESQSMTSRLSADAEGTSTSADATDNHYHHHQHNQQQQHLTWQIARMHQPVKIIHKENESISAFCINKVSTGLMTIATQKEVQELNISLLLNPNSWSEGMNEEADFDVLELNEDPENLPASSYLVIQTPGDHFLSPGIPPGASTGSGYLGSSTTGGSPAGGMIGSPAGMAGQPPPFGATPQQSNKGSSVVKRHRLDGVRRLASHSHLPLYVAGCQDGSIRMFEWSHSHAVQHIRPPGVFAKVNRVRFSAQGNKFGACDGDGTVSLWQAANSSAPFFHQQCHNKQTSDFTFQGGCSSLFCTAGHSSDGKNIALWDTLLPQKRCMVQSFNFHEHGASALAHAPQHCQLVTAGKKGQVAVWDIRFNNRILHSFKAHEQAVKCLAMDQNEEFFVTGSVAGDIKVWSFNSYKCLFSFPDEHCRHGIFKNISQGVSQVFVDQQNRLFSCGADGSMKVRQLPDRDLIVNY